MATWSWAAQGTVSNVETFFSNAALTGGNIIGVGISAGSAIALAYTPEGTVSWSLAATGAACSWQGVAATSDGGAILAGIKTNSTGTVTFGGSTSGTAAGILVAKVTSAGSVSWLTHTTGGRGYSVAPTSDGGAIIAGRVLSTAPATIGTATLSSSSHFAAKIGSSGSWSWATATGAFGGSNPNQTLDCAATPDGSDGAWIAGTFTGTSVTFGTATLTVSTATNVNAAYLARINSSGTWTSATLVGPTQNNSQARGVTTLSGSTYVYGYDVPNGKIFVAKVTSGTVDWSLSPTGATVKHGELDETRAAIIADSTQLALGGFTTGAATFGSTTIGATGQNRLLIARLTTSGSWVDAYEATAGINSGFYGLCKVSNAYIGVGGFDQSNAVFGSYTLTYSSTRQRWIAALSVAAVQRFLRQRQSPRRSPSRIGWY